LNKLIHLLAFSILLLVPVGAQNAYSQTIIFEDDYTTNAGWTQIPPTGVNVVTVDDPSFPDIVKFNAVPDGGSTNDIRVFKSLGTTLDNEWILESEFIVNDHPGNPPAHLIYTLSAGTDELTATNQAMIALHYSNTGDPGQGIQVFQKDGIPEPTPIGSKILVGIGEQTHIRFARTSATTATLEIFSDAARTLHFTGSPVQITGLLPTITGLNTLNHGNNFDGGTGRILTAEIDNTVIFVNDVVIGGELIPIETTSLLLASAQSFSWMIPVILSGIGMGLFVVSRKSE